MTKFLISTLFLVTAAWAQAQTVCTMAINSTDEIEAFKRHLQPQGFKFVDLTANADSAGKWLGKACKSGVQCDILVVSGHFAGSFFGESGIQLPLETLQEQRCSQTCDGILKHPTEAFLFGCNTLAGKTKDSRTPEEYANVLRGDDMEEATVEEIVAARYSPLGDSFRNRMLQVFANVPVVHGFDSISPSGEHVRAKIDEYFAQAGDYHARLAQIKNGQAATEVAIWQKDLSSTTRTSAPGAATLDMRQCQMFDHTVSVRQRLLDAQSMLLGPNPSAYLMLAGDFLLAVNENNLSDQDRQIYENIIQNNTLKNLVLNLLPQFTNAPNMRLDLLKLLGLWNDDPRVAQILMSASHEGGQVHQVAMNALQGTNDTTAVSTLSSAFQSKATVDDRDEAAETLQGTTNKAALQTLEDTLRNNPDPERRAEAAFGLQGTKDPQAIQTLITSLKKDSDPEVRSGAADALRHTTDPQALQALHAALSDSDSDVRRRAAHALGN